MNPLDGFFREKIKQTENKINKVQVHIVFVFNVHFGRDLRNCNIFFIVAFVNKYNYFKKTSRTSEIVLYSPFISLGALWHREYV